MKQVLLLGSGLVSGPLARAMLDRQDCRLLVADLDLAAAEILIAGHARGVARRVDVRDEAQLAPLVREANLVVSLVPAAHHAAVARLAVQHRVDLVTTSYVSPEMRALDGAARAAGVTLLNEVGLDPGLDHMSLMRMIDRARARGGRVTALTSCCGVVPAPDAADNPWQYKFSWSPRGALVAGRLAARYLHDGAEIRVTGAELIAHRRSLEVPGVATFETYPNRDSLPYIDLYGIQGVRGMLRATLRHPGWCETMQALDALGWLDAAERDWVAGTTWADVSALRVPAGRASLRDRVAVRLGVGADDPLLARLAWAGLLGTEPLARARAAPLDLLVERLQARLAYAPGERDMVVMQHALDVEHADRSERHVSQLVAFGEPGGESATSRTVSLPAALAGRLLLDGRLRAPGVQIPTVPEIYEPLLDDLEALGIAFDERIAT